jgi:hypothetical protein
MAPRGLLSFLCVAFQRVLSVSLLVSLALVGLYVVGNFQGFLDTTQQLLLDAARLALWVSCLGAALVVLLLLLTGLAERRLRVVRMVLALLAAGLSGALVLLLEFLAAWLAP